MASSGSGGSTALATSSSSGIQNSVRGRAWVGKVRCPRIRLSKCSHWKSCRGSSFPNGSGRTSSSPDSTMSSRRFPCWFRLQVLRRNLAASGQEWNGAVGPRRWPETQPAERPFGRVLPVAMSRVRPEVGVGCRRLAERGQSGGSRGCRAALRAASSSATRCSAASARISACCRAAFSSSREASAA